ncbi:MAG: hypothetical protein ACAI34_16500, partial [Verrucomicrobium sp.]
MDSDEKVAALKKLVARINESDVAAFAIMDYWTFDGYISLLKFLDEFPDVKLTKAVFPGMELRVDSPTEHRLNVHVLLSDGLTIQELADFKSGLKISGFDRPLSDDALRDFARTLDPSKAKHHGFADPATLDDDHLLRLGSTTAEVERTCLKRALKAIPAEAGVIVMPYDTSDGLEKLDWKTHPHADNYFMQSAHIFETRNPRSVDLFLNRETDANKAFIENFFKTLGSKCKPTLCGSDAHKIEDYGNYPSGTICWVKADTTFEGVLQLLHEPAARSFLGRMPAKLERLQANPTKYIRSIEVARIPGSSLTEHWFDGTKLVLNPDLIAIIGNKGSGKSALADVIGLLGMSKNEEFFSFPSPEKFRHSKRDLASHFRATITWHDGKSSTIALDEHVPSSAVERVKYLPQSYIERVCNELRTGESSAFDQELKQVIFSWVPDEERLNSDTLDELLDKRAGQIDQTIQILRSQLRELNAGIVDLELRSSAPAAEAIENRIKLKEAEISAHDALRPKAPPALTEAEAAALKSVSERMDEVRKQIIDCETKIKQESEALKDHLSRIAKINNVAAQMANLETQYRNFREKANKDAAEAGLDLDEIVSLKVNKSPIDARLSALQKEQQEIRGRLDETQKDSWPAKKAQA